MLALNIGFLCSLITALIIIELITEVNKEKEK